MEHTQDLTFVFPKPPPPGLFDAFIEKLPYCSEEIVGFDSNGSRSQVLIRLRPECDEAEVRTKIERFYGKLSRGFFPAETEVVVDNRSDREPRPVLDELLERRWIVPFAPGCIGLQGPALMLYEYFDDGVRSIGRSLGAADISFPTLIAIDTLNAANYLASFPHHVTVAARIIGDADNIEAFAENVQADRDAVLSSCKAPDHVLSPTVCIHCYQALQGRRLDPDELIRVTVRGNCFRHELGRLDHAGRLWDFHMREIIFVGGQEQVDSARAALMDTIVDWLAELGVELWIEGAFDPFFISSFSAQYFFQIAHKTKYELNMAVPGKTLSVGSFNLHQDFFGKAFDITHGNGAAYTSCAGFGLERLVYAFLCQFGLDTSAWPEEIRRRLREGCSLVAV